MKNKLTADEFRELLDSEDIDEFEMYANDGLSDDELKMVVDTTREKRMDSLFDDLNINKNKLKKAKRKTIKLSPKSTKYPLMSELYRDHKGKYKVNDLFIEYHDSILVDGIMIGMAYGKKFITEDIQNKRFTKEDIVNLKGKELHDYLNEEREEI